MKEMEEEANRETDSDENYTDYTDLESESEDE